MRPTFLALAGLILLAPLARSQTALYKDKTAPLEARVEDLLPRLSLDEKLQLLGGDRDFFIRAVPRLGLPAIKMSDGPLGVRNYGLSTAYPATVGLAASWDPALAREFGASVGRDARARGVGIMLGPAVNIARVPENGRNFEYLTEDPYLASILAPEIVAGMQDQGVVATVKHFAANNQETDRDTIDVRVSERALREIYLPAFRAAVEKGGAWAVMSAYNQINGVHCSADDWLNNKVLKGDWGFKGVLMSDWGAAHDTLGVTNGGLDLEMPSGVYMNPATLKPLLEGAKVSIATIDDKVRRILRLEIANGFLEGERVESTPKDDPKNGAVALQIAREGIVLLKNENSALPIIAKRTKTIVLLGPNASDFVTGGGSGHVEPFHFVSVAEGLEKVAGTKVKVVVIPGPGAVLLDRLVSSAAYEGPLKLEFLEGNGPGQRVVATQKSPRIDANWREDPAPGVPLAGYMARWTGTIRAPSSGAFTFLVRAHGNVSVNLDGRKIIGSWFTSSDTLFAEVQLEEGKTYPIEVNVHHDGVGSPAVRFAWGPTPPLLTEADSARVRSADAVVVCAGFNLMLEGEGADRPFALPDAQTELIRAAAKLNPRTIVVLNSGGSVDTAGWLGSAAALLQAWYPGQEGGQAVAEVLMGKTNPSGKLPVSFERQRKDSASYGNFPGANGKVDYAEGILVGYRWFDAKGLQPQFPFGFGLSYTTFHYGGLKVEQPDSSHVSLTFEVTNNGTRAGTEVAQIYVSAPFTSKVQRPVRELKGFCRVPLAAEETKTVSVHLDRSAFEYYDEAKGAWEVEPGTYTVAVGSSSRKILLTNSVEIQ